MELEEIKKLSLLEKMMLITSEVKKVTKNLVVGTGKSSYKAVAEEDILDAVKDLETKYRVYSYPCNREIVDSEKQKKIVLDYDGNEKESITYYAKLKTTYRFNNVDNKEEFLEMVSYSEAIDTGDKGFGKAQTYADKYALMKAYKIPTGNDPDSKPSPNEEDLESQGLTLEKAKAYIVNYKKHQGKTFEQVYKEDKQYIEWLINSNKASAIIVKCFELLEEEQNKNANTPLNVLLKLIEETNTPESSIYTHFNKTSLNELKNNEIEQSIKTLQNKKASMQKSNELNLTNGGSFKIEDVKLEDSDLPF